MEDKDIIRVMREKGDFSYVYSTLYDMSHGYIKKRGWCEYVDFDDVFQNTVIILVKNIGDDKFKLKCKLSTYFIGILSNQTKKGMGLNSRIKTEPLAYDREFKEEVVEDESPKIKTLVNLSLSKLSTNQRKIVKLMYYDNKSQVDISKLLGLSNSHSVKTQKYKAFKILRETINLELKGVSLDEYLID